MIGERSPSGLAGLATRNESASVDVRLASGAGCAWLALVACIGRSPGCVVVAGLTAVLGGVAGLLASGRGTRGAAGFALAAFCVALVLIPFAGRLVHSRAAPAWQLAQRHAAVTAELTVTSDPRRLAAKGVAGTARVAVGTDIDALTVGGRSVAGAGTALVLGPAAAWRGIVPGQQVRLDGTLRPSLDSGAMSVTMFAESPPVLTRGPPWWQLAAVEVRTALNQASAGLPDPVRGLLPGLVDGDTSALDPVLADRFRLAGLTHLVAVSGTNCSILIGAVLLILRRLRARPWLCALAGGLVLLGFVVVARPSPSVLRAAVMAAIALAALAGGRPKQALPALSAAVIGLLVWDPMLGVDAGFTMSVLATAALLLIAPGWADALRRRHVPVGVAEAVAVAAAAHVVTAPVVAAISGRVSLVAVPANVLAEPVVAAATIWGFAAAVVAPLWLGAGSVLAWLAGWPCRWLVWVADHFGGVPGAALPWPGGTVGGLALLAASAIGWCLLRRAGPGRVLAAAAGTALLVQIPARTLASGWPPPGWLFVACDVGQGDALVLSAGPHSAVAIDAGPDPIAVDRCLRGLGITEVPLLVLTHYHLDHVGGVAGVFHGRHVGRVLTGPLADPAAGVALVRTALVAHHLSGTTPPAGQGLDVGRIHLDVLGPPAVFRGTRSDPNNSSLVLRARVGGTTILLPGDAEVEAQQALLDSGAGLRADVLKVAHHGSAYSSPAFLAAVHARVAVISVGLHNDYGHPSPLLLAELVRLGVPVRRTDRDGDVAVCGSPGSLSVVGHGVAASVGI